MHEMKETKFALTTLHSIVPGFDWPVEIETTKKFSKPTKSLTSPPKVNPVSVLPFFIHKLTL